MHSFMGLRSFPLPEWKMTVKYIVFVCLTDGICSPVLRTLHLLQSARLKIQQHMWYSGGVSHGAMAKSQTGCKCRSAFSSPSVCVPCCPPPLKLKFPVFRDLPEAAPRGCLPIKHEAKLVTVTRGLSNKVSENVRRHSGWSSSSAPGSADHLLI